MKSDSIAWCWTQSVCGHRRQKGAGKEANRKPAGSRPVYRWRLAKPFAQNCDRWFTGVSWPSEKATDILYQDEYDPSLSRNRVQNRVFL